jgi:adenosylhomocysteinase
MQRAGRLPFPAIAGNDAWSKHLFDNRHGTGQSALSAIQQLTNLGVAGRMFCVVGYGWVGRGIAQYARGLGARVTVVEVDPIAALEALMDGHDIANLSDAAPRADVLVTATGGINGLGSEHFALLKDGVLLANAGHDRREIDVAALAGAAHSAEEKRPGVVCYTLDGGTRVYLLVQGELVNIAGGQGHPADILDLSFSVQLAAARLLASENLTPGLHKLPESIDRQVARTKLGTLGIVLDELTPEQTRFREQWAVE